MAARQTGASRFRTSRSLSTSGTANSMQTGEVICDVVREQLNKVIQAGRALTPRKSPKPHFDLL